MFYTNNKQFNNEVHAYEYAKEVSLYTVKAVSVYMMDSDGERIRIAAFCNGEQLA